MLMRTTPLSYVGEDGIVGCFLLFILFMHHKMLSNERANDIAFALKGKKLVFSSGWVSAVKGREIVKSQKISSKPSNKSRSKSPPMHDLEDMQAMLAARHLDFIDEL